MITDVLGDLLRETRKALGLTQKEIAERAEVSTRLWAEVERGERPNVSLATALRMLSEVGVVVRLNEPLGTSRELRDAGTDAAARAARAAMRRTTWTGRQVLLEQEGADDQPPTSGRDRLAAVTVVSEQAFAIARGRAARIQRKRAKVQAAARR